MKPKQVELREINERIGRRLHTRRRLLGLTLKQVGDPVGIGFQQVQKYEIGANSMSAARLSLIAKKLDVPLEYFFSDPT